MKMLMLVCWCTCLFSVTRGQDAASLSKEAERLEALPNERAALLKFKEVLTLQPANIYVLNKCSELCSRIGKRMKDSRHSEDFYAAAKTYAAKALKINPNNSESNCVMAIALGRSSLNRSGKEKINNAKEIKRYVDAAIKNDPKNFKAWHVLGRWHYEISTLNAVERAAVRLFFGGLPNASLAGSIAAFEKSQAITNGFILNYFEMAKAYHKNSQTSKAITLLTLMQQVPNQTEDDPIIKSDGRKLINEWR